MWFDNWNDFMKHIECAAVLQDMVISVNSLVNSNKEMAVILTRLYILETQMEKYNIS